MTSFRESMEGKLDSKMEILSTEMKGLNSKIDLNKKDSDEVLYSHGQKTKSTRKRNDQML